MGTGVINNVHYVQKIDERRIKMLERRQKDFMKGAKAKFDMVVETYNEKLKMLEDDFTHMDAA